MEKLTVILQRMTYLVDTINQNPLSLPYDSNDNKIYANIFLDDKAGLENKKYTRTIYTTKFKNLQFKLR